MRGLTPSAEVDVTGSLTHQRDGFVTGAGKLDSVGTGTLILTAANTYSGGTIVENGVLQIGHNTALGTGGITVKTGRALAGLLSSGLCLRSRRNDGSALKSRPAVVRCLSGQMKFMKFHVTRLALGANNG